MAKVSSSQGFLLVLAIFAMAAASVTAQSSAPAPAPSLDTGAAVSLPVSFAFLGSSLIFSLLALFMKH
ncbi:No apical meristem (NAM) protein [Melia azedarach]|uniref:No apical meristem (NAM) protein n=1 Tax=Melia azedarach TaxID=155640 RepID=A0ACC1X5S5_MELAZ|nr:No apical meristem (NAM) protein [Melia azedarach]